MIAYRRQATPTRSFPGTSMRSPRPAGVVRPGAVGSRSSGRALTPAPACPSHYPITSHGLAVYPGYRHPIPDGERGAARALLGDGVTERHATLPAQAALVRIPEGKTTCYPQRDMSMPANPNPDLEKLMAAAADRLRAEFEKARNVPHPSLRGRARERALIEVLNTYLPRRFAATSGYILDPMGLLSPHLDVIIYDALNSPIYFASEEAQILPSDNVAVVIEVKSQLTKAELSSAIYHLSRAKRLGKSSPKSRIHDGSDWRDGEHPTGRISTQTVLFAYGSKMSLDEIGNVFMREYTAVPPGTQIDFIVLLDDGVVSLCMNDSRFSLPPHVFVPGTFSWIAEGDDPTSLFVFFPPDSQEVLTFEGAHLPPGAVVAMGARRLGSRTLDAMFRLLVLHLGTFRGWITYPGGNWGSIGTKEYVTIWPLAVCVDKTAAQPLHDAAQRYHEVLEALQKYAKPGNDEGSG